MTRLILSLFVLLGVIFPAYALESEKAGAEHLQLQLITAKNGVTEEISAGILVDFEEHWHSYWRTPGDSGLAPVFDWSKSQNVKNVILSWPKPARFELFGFYTFIYPEDVLFPIKVIPADAGQPVELVIEANIMACNKLCVPQEASVRLDIPVVEVPKETAEAARLAQAIKNVPQKESKELSIDTAVLSSEAMVITITSKEGFEKTDLFVEAGEDFSLTSPVEFIENKEDPAKAMLKLTKPPEVADLSEALAGKTVTLTLINRDNALEKDFSF